ncbi:MAG: transcription elongation factor GreB [Wenzhouxiangellaceae bacterium]
MSRWRPPGARSSPYITAQGLENLKAELKQLWVDRRDVVAALTAAAAEGDRSENAEYIYRKKQLREMDRRIRYLGKRSDEVRPVAGSPSDSGRVFFGAWVTIEEAGAQTCRYRIVGADEIDPQKGWISVDSPLARGLLGKPLDEELAIETPSGRRQVTIAAIDYDTVPETGSEDGD